MLLDTMLRIEGVSKRYSPPPLWLRPLVRTAVKEPFDALVDVSFEVGRGEIVGLVGPNGAGKTTLIKILGTLLTPTTGTAIVGGVDIAANPHEVRHRLGLVLSDDRGFYWRLSGRANLEFFGVMAGLAPALARARARELLDRVGLAERDKLVFGYSAGMRTRLGIARALLADPPLIVLDEATRSLDPLASKAVALMLRSLAAEGRAVLLSSHRLDEVVSLCDRVVVLVAGKVRYSGTPSQLAADPSDAAAKLMDLLSAGESLP